MNNILCLNIGTKILMSNGTQTSIENIAINDFIKSYSFKTARTEIVQVLKIARSFHSIINCVSLSNGQTIECTTDHPIWTTEKGWCSVAYKDSQLNYNIAVHELQIGDTCFYLQDNILEKVKITSIETQVGDYEMYDITGGENHCFFANGLLVHDENLSDLTNIDGLLIAEIDRQDK